MHGIPGFHRNAFLFILATVIVSALAAGNKAPIRLDIFDASNNHLMYVTFGYDETGRNISRSVFMSDETFVRDVTINYDALGRRANEVSYNFNGDTSFVTRYAHSETGSSFSIVDQFKLDHVGGNVAYSTTDSPNFGLVYESGSQAASMAYYKDAEGNLERVEIADPTGTDTYYGVFTNGDLVGATHPFISKDLSPQAVIRPRGASQIDVRFNLRSAGEVTCELLTLSGRRAATLLSGRMKQGRHTRTFRFNSGSLRRIANGVYLFTVSVDGVTVSHSRYLHQSMTAGGVQ